MPARLDPVPPLEAVMQNPELVERLPRSVAIEYRRAIQRLAADLEAHITTSGDGPVAVRTPDHDRAVGLTEASQRLGIKRRTLERRAKWRQLGGYRDIDGHIKFRLIDLHRHLARRSTMLG
jgi:hypothetical protein